MSEAQPQQQQQQQATDGGGDAGAIADINKGLQQRAAAATPGGAKSGDLQGAGGEQQQQQQEGGAPTPQEEIRTLRDRLAKLENDQTARNAKREAEDVTDAFVRATHPDYPRELVRRFLPVTTNGEVLMREAANFDKMIKQIIDAHVKSGRIRYVDIGGSPGGQSPAEVKNTSNASPADLITQGLNQRRHSGKPIGGPPRG